MNSRFIAAGVLVRGLRGWRRLTFAFAAGLASSLAFAPFDVFPAMLLGYAALVLLIDGAMTDPRPVRRAALAGWAFFFGQYVLGLHWIAFAFLVDPIAHAWQIPIVFIFMALLALFGTAACAAAAAVWRSGPSRLFALAAALALAEWLRGHVLTGFPWNIPAYGWGASLAVLQSAALFGAYALSLLTILFGASLADLFAPRRALAMPAVMAGVFAALWAGGAIRLAATTVPDVPGVSLRLVQPNVPQAEKYQPEFVMRNWERLVSLSAEPGSPTLIVWPEAAPPFLLSNEPEALSQIAALASHKQGLVTGGIRRVSRHPSRYSNALFIFGGDGRPVTYYDKFHLVPFGEYLPYEETLNALGLAKLTGIEGSFVEGPGLRTFAIPGAGTVGPLICYEILFPGAVVGAKRPDWLVNVTDDSWFGPWAGPRQHLLVARVRAIEEGLPVVRDANTGISAIIDPLGRITSSLGLDRMGVVDGALPAAIAPTPYSRTPAWWFWSILSAIVALSWFCSRRK